MAYLPSWLRRATASRIDSATWSRLVDLLAEATQQGMPAKNAPPDKGPAAPGVDRTSGIDALQECMKSMRDDLRKFGGALAAGASAVVVGLGWATIHNVYPVPAVHPALVGWGAFALGLLAVGASAYLAVQFFAAQRRIVFKPSDVEKSVGLRTKEKALVSDILREHAEEEMAVNPLALELRAMRLGRIARLKADSAPQLSASVQAESSRLYDTLALAEARATLSVLERRSQQLFRLDGPPAAAACIAVLSIVGLFLLADYSKGERDRIDLLDKCHKAVVAGATTACDPIATRAPSSFTPPPTNASSPSQADIAIIQRAADCANYTPTPSPITGPLREAAIARCAGLPLPSPSPSATP